MIGLIPTTIREAALLHAAPTMGDGACSATAIDAWPEAARITIAALLVEAREAEADATAAVMAEQTIAEAIANSAAARREHIAVLAINPDPEIGDGPRGALLTKTEASLTKTEAVAVGSWPNVVLCPLTVRQLTRIVTRGVELLGGAR